MRSDPFFSVIIPTYNRSGPVCGAVRSVLAQTFPDYELILVDDGSTDDTPLRAGGFGSPVRYVRQQHRGVSAARNLGISLAKGEYIAFLDSDDLWLPGKLSAQREFIASNPEFRLHQTGEIWIRNGTRVNPKSRHHQREGMIFSESLNLCLISPSAAALHRSVFEDFGLFDESLPACEDYDLWLRITLEEPVGLVKSGLVVRHGGHEDQLSRKHWGMDRFRVYSILKLLEARSGAMTVDNRFRAERVLMEKLHILKQGAMKRGKTDFADKIATIIEAAAGSRYSSIDRLILLEE